MAMTHPPIPPGGAVVIIPARLASTRFPRKVLADRTGRPLVQHVCEAASRAAVAAVVVAADDEEIARALRPAGVRVVLTSPAHDNGTSRVAEAARTLALEPGRVIVNVQGDEPELEPGAINAAVDTLTASGADIATLAAPLAPDDDPHDPAIVKVVRALDGTALYFSRACIPHQRDPGSPAPATPLRHVGLYAYTRAFLERYATLPPTPLEQAERLEQLRALQHAHRIAVALVPSGPPGIDTPEQYDAFVRRWHARRP